MIQYASYVATFGFILFRGYLHFSGEQTSAAVLDLAVLPMYALACLQNPRWIYLSIVAYLPGSSVLYLATAVIPFDLSIVIILLSLTALAHQMRERKSTGTIVYALVTYGVLAAYLFANIAFESLFELQEIREQMKVLYFLVTATLAGFLFWKIFDPKDAVYLQRALLCGVGSYIVAGCVGYLFPLATFTWEAESEFRFKSLFRYPGLSSSNYLAHVMLLLIAMHKYLGDRTNRAFRPLVYISVLLVLAVVSQSRGFALTAFVLVLLWWGLDVVRKFGERIVRVVRWKGGWSSLSVLLISLGALIVFLDFFLILGEQTIDRLTFGDSSTINVSRRLDEWQDTFSYFQSSGRSVLRGNLAYPEQIRPHNVVLGAILVFGVPIAAAVLILLLAMLLRFPLLFFVFLAAQGEILFVTGTYDFLFLTFLTLLCSRPYWSHKDIVVMEERSK